MVTLPLDATDRAILTTLNVWLNHLAHDDYQQAFDFAYHPECDDSTPEALREQVAFVPGGGFFVDEGHDNFIRLNFSNSAPEMIEEGVKRIGSALKRRLA